MKKNRILPLLATTLSVLVVVPFGAATFFFENTLQTTLNLTFNENVIQTLQESSENLKKLGNLDPANDSEYKNQFNKLQELRQVYDNPALVRGHIKGSLQLYFFLGLCLAMSLALAVAFLLSRKINSSYQVLFEELIIEKDKVNFLEEISSWQELAKMLAHEIKNPLTPITILMSSLRKSYFQKDKIDFESQLDQTCQMVDEELFHLKSMVDRFVEFSRLPQVQLAQLSLPQSIERIIKHLSVQFPQANITFKNNREDVEVLFDEPLFRQVFANLVKNGLEANPGKKIAFDISIEKKSENKLVSILVKNNGQPIPPHIRKRIFDPYFSNKAGKNNMGLGLTIVKKTVIEHGGQVLYQEVNNLPGFLILLPEIGNSK